MRVSLPAPLLLPTQADHRLLGMEVLSAILDEELTVERVRRLLRTDDEQRSLLTPLAPCSLSQPRVLL